MKFCETIFATRRCRSTERQSIVIHRCDCNTLLIASKPSNPNREHLAHHDPLDWTSGQWCVPIPLWLSLAMTRWIIHHSVNHRVRVETITAQFFECMTRDCWTEQHMDSRIPVEPNICQAKWTSGVKCCFHSIYRCVEQCKQLEWYRWTTNLGARSHGGSTATLPRTMLCGITCQPV